MGELKLVVGGTEPGMCPITDDDTRCVEHSTGVLVANTIAVATTCAPHGKDLVSAALALGMDWSWERLNNA